MATLFRHRNGIYYLKWPGPNGRERRKSLRTKDRGTAKRLQREIERQNTLAHFGVDDEGPVDLTWQDALALYMDTAPLQKRASTIHSQRTSFKLFFEFCSVATLRQVTKRDVMAWQDHMLRDGRSPVTCRTRVTQAKAFVAWLIEREDYTGPNPFAAVKHPQGSNARRERLLEWDEVLRLLDCAKAHSPDMHLLVALCALAGLRMGEAQACRWNWIDWDRGLLFVAGQYGDDYEPKTEASRDCVPIIERLDTILQEHHDGQPQDAYLIKPDKPMLVGASHRWYPYNHFAAVVKQAGLADTGVCPHVLRHSVASKLAELGYEAFQIQRFLRHESLSSTMRYVHRTKRRLVIEGL